MSLKSRLGFSLIELLVVIAIIAILAALLFPVFSRAKEGVRQTSCMSHMHDIYVQVNQYKMDEGVYPSMLLGYAEKADGTPLDPTTSTTAVPLSSIKHGFLFPRYIKDIDVFHCPDNPKIDQTQVAPAGYPITSPWNGVLSGGNATVASLGLKGLASYANQPVGFYTYDSYDVSSFMSVTGTTNGNFLVAYTSDWSANGPMNIPGTQDSNNQLKYKEPPPDKTIITICNRHVTTAGGDKCPVLLLSGSVKPLSFKLVYQKGWNTAN